MTLREEGQPLCQHVCMFCTQMPFHIRTSTHTGMHTLLDYAFGTAEGRVLDLMLRCVCVPVFTHATPCRWTLLVEPIPALHTTPSSHLDQWVTCMNNNLLQHSYSQSHYFPSTLLLVCAFMSYSTHIHTPNSTSCTCVTNASLLSCITAFRLFILKSQWSFDLEPKAHC